jgi:hypothetical protein
VIYLEKLILFRGNILKKYLIGLLLISHLTIAQETQKASTPPEADTNSLGQSAENRTHLKYQLTFAPIAGEYDGTENNFAFSAGYFYDAKNLINLRYTFQNSPGTLGNSSTRDYPQTTRAITFGDRYFFGNSFNAMGSVYWRQHSKYDRSTHATYFYKDYGVGLRIGNEWQWENFTMGCDWFGLNHTLIKVNDTFPENGYATEKSLTMVLLNFYLGISF